MIEQRWNCTHPTGSKAGILNLDIRVPAAFCGHSNRGVGGSCFQKECSSCLRNRCGFPRDPVCQQESRTGRCIPQEHSPCPYSGAYSGTGSFLFTRNSYDVALQPSAVPGETGSTVPRSACQQSPALFSGHADLCPYLPDLQNGNCLLIPAFSLIIQSVSQNHWFCCLTLRGRPVVRHFFREWIFFSSEGAYGR